MKSSSRLFVVAVALALAAGLAHAQAQERGFYAGAAAGQATVRDFCTGFSGPGTSCDEKATALRAFGGFQVTKYLAGEVAYTDLGSVSASLGTAKATVKGVATELDLVGTLPFLPVVAPYGKVGVYRASSRATSNFGFSETVTNTGFTYAAGVRLDLGRRFALRGEWQRYQDVGGGVMGKTDVDVLTLGGLFKF